MASAALKCEATVVGTQTNQPSSVNLGLELEK